MWDKLQNTHEGDDKVKKEKIQTHRSPFEILKMNEEENIARYLLCVDEIVNITEVWGKPLMSNSSFKKYSGHFL